MDGGIGPSPGAAGARVGLGAPGRREMFYLLVNVDEHHEVLDGARRLIGEALASADPDDLPDALAWSGAVPDEAWLDAAAAWRGGLAGAVAAALAFVPEAHAIDVLRQCAPAVMVDGCWAQYVSDALASHTALTSQLLGPWIERVGGGDLSAHMGRAFADLASGMGCALAEPDSWAFAHDEALTEAAFAAPVLRLALSLFPHGLLAELLGWNLYEAVRGGCPIVQALAPPHRFGALWTSFEARARPRHAALAALRAHLAAPDVEGAAFERAARGFAAAYAADAAARGALIGWATGPALGPRARMIELVRRRAPSAIGYHGRGRLEERGLDAWFAEAGRDAARFVDALGRSGYVVPGDAEASPLLATLSAGRGPMAGIFTKPERAVIVRWIESLAGPPASPPAGGWEQPPMAALPPAGCAAPAAAVTTVGATAGAELPIRELYHRMLHVEAHPETLPLARKFAASWLTRAGRIKPGDPKAIPFETYTHAALETWLVEQHARQVATFAAEDGEPALSREALIESCVQLCPTVLIDGAWLQRVSGVGWAGTEVGAKLFRIYLDEVGDGSPDDNHPNVYRELIASMGVEMPDFGTHNFAMWPRFRDESFQLPTFWLCVSRFPRHFLPELLGLNLAIELSGVGGTYRTTSHALRHYGYDSLFVDLHNTVDNVSTGHTAIALRAVTAHMDEVLQRGGRQEVQRRWQRVWTGFRALAAA